MPGGTGYTNFSDWYALNQPQAQAQAQGMLGQLTTPATGGQTQGANAGGMQAQGDVPGAATGYGTAAPLPGLRQDVTQDVLNSTKGVYGLQSAYDSKYGRNGGYTPGQSLYDAALTNQAGARDFQGLRDRYAQMWAQPAPTAAGTSAPPGTSPPGPTSRPPPTHGQLPAVPPPPPMPPTPIGAGNPNNAAPEYTDPLQRGRRRVGY